MAVGRWVSSLPFPPPPAWFKWLEWVGSRLPESRNKSGREGRPGVAQMFHRVVFSMEWLIPGARRCVQSTKQLA